MKTLRKINRKAIAIITDACPNCFSKLILPAFKGSHVDCPAVCEVCGSPCPDYIADNA